MAPTTRHQQVLDERGFIFTLPRLGLPDPRLCEPVLVKAAIGPRAAALDLLFNSSATSSAALQTRREGHISETGLVDIECRGSLWILPLLKPASNKRNKSNAEVEVFNINLPDNSDWVFFPLEAYEAQIAEKTCSSGGDPQHLQCGHRRYFVAIDAGTAAQAQAKAQTKKEQQKKPAEEEEDEAEQLAKIMAATTLTSDMYDPAWLHALKLSTMLDEANNGNPLAAVHDTQRLKLRLRIHPAEDDEYKSIDYMVRRQDEKEEVPVGEEKWKTLPGEATKGGVQRLFVNMHRRRKGKRALSEEEWTSTRSK